MIRYINIDITTVCNSKCPFCPRTEISKKTKVPKKHLDLEIFKKLDWESLPVLKHFLLCGNLGEPTLYPDLDNFIKFSHELNKEITLHTNGISFNENWWSKLANKLNPNDRIVFGLDGLTKETHEKHRGTNFKRLIKNIKAFVNSGGQARANFIVFKHNEHELPKIEYFMETLGITFKIRPSREYNDVLEKPEKKFKFSKRYLNTRCYPEDGEIATDIDGKIHLCCYSATRHYYKDLGLLPENVTILKKYDTFRELQKSIYWKYLRKMKFCQRCE
jgi:MoaA/NifB/PqqE/SkfB family radical SAM enzyme